MRKFEMCALACAAAFAAAAGERVLWPSAEAELRAQNDSSIALLPDGSMGVKTGVKDRWPGTRLDFKAGVYDLTPYDSITISVSNTTDRACTVHLSVKGENSQGAGPGGSVALAPHATGEIVAQMRAMPWELDAPLALEGMNGKPVAKDGRSAKGGGGFDLSRANSFHIFFTQDGSPRGFSVRRITVSAEVERKVKTLGAATFMPFVDRFGQFKHDDWPGKVHDEKGLAESRRREEAWLAAHRKSPIEGADKWGGWAAGPQLKATGFFRTEKVNGKWWLVDPEGRLFFSHGVDCVRVGGETGIGFREKYFEWVPEKDDPVYGRFLWTNKWPGAHGFYKDPAHLPYACFSFAQANARRKYGEKWRELVRERAHERIRAWGLNTIANWSDSSIYLMDRTPYTLCLGTGGTPRLANSSGWWGALPDPFNPEFEKTFRSRARDAAKRMKNDPWCVGVFVDNELSWNSEPRMAEVAEKYFSTIRAVLKDGLPHRMGNGGHISRRRSPLRRGEREHLQPQPEPRSARRRRGQAHDQR